jgi:hypothetical protein
MAGGFRNVIHDLREIRRYGEVCVVGAFAVERLEQRDLAQYVHVALAAFGKTDFRLVKKIELSRKWASGPQRAAGGGFEFAMLAREPGADEAGFGKPDAPDQNGMRLFHVIPSARSGIAA